MGTKNEKLRVESLQGALMLLRSLDHTIPAKVRELKTWAKINAPHLHVQQGKCNTLVMTFGHHVWEVKHLGNRVVIETHYVEPGYQNAILAAFFRGDNDLLETVRDERDQSEAFHL